MSKTSVATSQRPMTNRSTIILLFGAGILLFLFAGWLWWTRVYLSPSNVFWGMVDNNLSTQGITRSIKTSQGNATVEQQIRTVYAPHNQTYGLTTITQETADGTTKVVTENLGTRTGDFVRYTEVKAPTPEGKEPLDFSSVEGLWAKRQATGEFGQFFHDAARGLVQGAVPFGNLTAEQRTTLLQLMREKQVYTTDFSSAEKRVEDGKQVFVYTLSVKPAEYIEVLKEFSEMAGLEHEDLAREMFEGAAPFTLEIAVRPASRQLVRLTATGNDYEERYSGYGITRTTNVPEHTVTETELQAKWQDVLDSAKSR